MFAERVVAIYSDPGRTSMFIRRLLAQDAPRGEPYDGGSWSGSASGISAKPRNPRPWSPAARITHQQVLLPLRPDGTLDLDEVQHRARDDGGDITVVVTEVPRMAGRRPKTIELHFADRLAVISLPTLGPVLILRSLGRELGRAISALSNHTASSDETASSHETVTETQAADAGSVPEEIVEQVNAGWGVRVEAEAGRQTVYTTSPRWVPGRAWATLGMVASNEPLWAMRKLAGLFTAAAAISAFGIFYSTIWEMASFLSGWRLTSVSIVCVALLAAWLIISNRLWERSGSTFGKREAFMYNTSTVVTLLASIAMLYLLLFVAVLGMGTLLIDPAFMEQEIGEPADFGSYVDVAWLSASLGSLAGALGSNFDSDAHVENLTQGSRELQRYPRDQAQQ